MKDIYHNNSKTVTLLYTKIFELNTENVNLKRTAKRDTRFINFMGISCVALIILELIIAI